MKKILIALVLLGVLAVAGCNKKSETTNNMQPTITTKIDEYKFQEREIISGHQKYQEGDLRYPDSLWETPDWNYEESLDFGVEGVKGLFYTSPIKYNNKQTRIAAYIGFPKTASKENKCPAIVLVHGGLGTAMPDWVKYWNDLGFAAISIDTEGGEPLEGAQGDNCAHIERNRYENDDTYTCGPTNNGFSDSNLPIESQWYYHATSSVILATSLLKSFECVDEQRIGMTGISWGSMIVSVVVGYDDRISFCMPVYGALSLNESCSGFKTIYQNQQNIDRWDTLEPLKQTNCKMFYVTSLNDFAFSFDAASRSSKAANGFTLFKKAFVHGQAPGAFEANLPFFAKYFCGMESEFVEILENPTKDNPVLKFRTYGDIEINSIKLYYTDSINTDKNAEWENKTIKYINGLNEYTLNIPDCSHFYVQIKYNNNLEVSSYLG